MQDVNGSSFFLLADPADWSGNTGMAPSGSAYALAGKQNWRLPTTTRAPAQAALAASHPVVVDAYSGIARIKQDGSGVQSLDAANWVDVVDQNQKSLSPKVGKFTAMALGGGRLALLSTDGVSAFLELFDLRGRWPLDSPQNPALPLTLDPAGSAVAVAADGPILVLVHGGLAIFEGGPIDMFFAKPAATFAPVAANSNALRQTALIANRPAGAAVAMTVDPDRVAILLDQGSAPQTLALLDRVTGAWTSVVLAAPLPYMTDVALLKDGLIALMSPAGPGTSGPLDCAVVTVSSQGLTLAPHRYPMLDQYAPRFASIPGPDVFYLGVGATADTPAPRRLLPLPYPAYLTSGALVRFAVPGNDPDQVWHRLYAEANLPHGTSLAIWARAAETRFGDAVSQAASAADQAALLAILLAAPANLNRLGPVEAAEIITANSSSLSPLSSTLTAALTLAPFHRQPPLAAVSQPSELPFHPGLAALAGMPGTLYEVLLQRSGGENRRLTGAFFDLVVVAAGDGRHSPCLRAIRIYSPRFCYQDQYLPALFHQTMVSDEADVAAMPSPPDFRERLLANFEGMLTPIENRVAAAEYLLDPNAAPASTLPWLFSYFGRTPDPGWPEARSRRALANMGRQFRARGTYRGVCLALDIATDGAVARGEVVLLETFRLRRAFPTVLGIPMGGRNVLTADAVPSGNSIVGDTLTLSAERAIDMLALLAPSAAATADPTAMSQFLEGYAERVQVTAILQGPSTAALRPVVSSVLQAELPKQLSFDIVLTDKRFIIGLSPLLDVDTFLDPPAAPAPLTLNQSVVGIDAVVRDPAALRQ